MSIGFSLIFSWLSIVKFLTALFLSSSWLRVLGLECFLLFLLLVIPLAGRVFAFVWTSCSYDSWLFNIKGESKTWSCCKSLLSVWIVMRLRYLELVTSGRTTKVYVSFLRWFFCFLAILSISNYFVMPTKSLILWMSAASVSLWDWFSELELLLNCLVWAIDWN